MNQKKNINERFLRQIWQKKIFNEENLKTLDGSSLKIISTGNLNTDGGPDFKNSKIQIGDVVYDGDIEIHRDISDWLLHSHSGNPKYNNTILHVVLYNQASFVPTFTHSGRKVPVLILEEYLDRPLADVWEEAIVEDREERNKTIVCFEENKKVPLEKKYIWLERLGYRRLEARIKHLEERLKFIIESSIPPPSNSIDKPENQSPQEKPIQEKFRERKFWEQLFYEGIMEGMGYSKNREPFIKLSQLLSLEYLRQKIDLSKQDALIEIQSLLFGVSGLIPQINEVKDEETIKFINTLNAYWAAGDYSNARINKSEWQFFRLRPQNFPTIRLAGICYLLPSLLKGILFKNSIQFIRRDGNKVEEVLKNLTALFSVECSGYWSKHFTFSPETRKESKILIGQNRIDDIIINSLLPMVILYGRKFREFRLEKSAMSLYHLYPHISDNDTSRILVDQFLEGNPLKTAKQQQGAIQLYKFYCSDAKCSKCDVGKILKGLTIEPAEKEETVFT
jgi:hypothetical protein